MRLNFHTLDTLTQKTRGQVGTLGTTSIHAGLGCPQKSENAGDRWGQTASPSASTPPDTPVLSPMSPIQKTNWGHGKPSVYAAVPNVPSVPTKKTPNEIDREAFEERAAIMEFDGGLSRAEAERLAAESLGVAL